MRRPVIELQSNRVFRMIEIREWLVVSVEAYYSIGMRCRFEDDPIVTIEYLVQLISPGWIAAGKIPENRF